MDRYFTGALLVVELSDYTVHVGTTLKDINSYKSCSLILLFSVISALFPTANMKAKFYRANEYW